MEGAREGRKGGTDDGSRGRRNGVARAHGGQACPFRGRAAAAFLRLLPGPCRRPRVAAVRGVRPVRRHRLRRGDDRHQPHARRRDRAAHARGRPTRLSQGRPSQARRRLRRRHDVCERPHARGRRGGPGVARLGGLCPRGLRHRMGRWHLDYLLPATFVIGSLPLRVRDACAELPCGARPGPHPPLHRHACGGVHAGAFDDCMAGVDGKTG